jgi:hypothetical protein
LNKTPENASRTKASWSKEGINGQEKYETSLGRRKWRTAQEASLASQGIILDVHLQG